MKYNVHKIASAVHHLSLPRTVDLLTEPRHTQNGEVVVVKAKAEKRFYGQLELASGRMAKIFRGDVIIGALGSRRALKGFVGSCPAKLAPGDELAILNLGGVMGLPEICSHPDLGSPCPVELIGFVKLNGQVASVPSVCMPPSKKIDTWPPLVVVSGTCMASGKTRAACEIIHELVSRGRKIHSAKLSGVACRRDILNMADHGACRTASFLDCGLVSTVDVPNLPEIAHRILAFLAADRPDLIVLELGDGIFGEYGVMPILESLKDHPFIHVLCATDPAGAWGAHAFLKREGMAIDIISGSCTDNHVGVRFVEEHLELQAINAYAAPEALGQAIETLLAKQA